MGCLMDAALYLSFVQSHILRAESDVLVYRLLEYLILGILENKSHLEADVTYLVLVSPDVLALKEHLARRGLENSVEMLYKRGFA